MFWVFEARRRKRPALYSTPSNNPRTYCTKDTNCKLYHVWTRVLNVDELVWTFDVRASAHVQSLTVKFDIEITVEGQTCQVYASMGSKYSIFR